MSILEPGTSFANRFDIEGLAGSGGMGAVYRARDRYTGERVALKLMHAEDESLQASERFAREALLLRELRHPGIVAHVAHGQTPDGRHFLAMEWLDGHDLGVHLKRGPFPLGEAVLLVRRVAEALEVAHRQGVIHRDLKPTNLFLVAGEVGGVKVLDFGIARRVGASHARTRTGLVLGTPDYMAPEQARGERDLGPAADVFSLGCILYECLTGEPPFVAEHVAAVLTRILFEHPPPIEDRRPGVPALLRALVGRMLAKHPGQRPADASALLGELGDLGELPATSFAPTVEIMTSPSSPPGAAFAEREQGLLCLIIAAARPRAAGHDGGDPRGAVSRQSSVVSPSRSTHDSRLTTHDSDDPPTPGPAGHDGGDPHTPGPAGHDGGDPHTPGPAGTVTSGEERLADADRRRRGTLKSTLRSLGVQADFLVDGSLVVTVPATGSATDQAAHAARAALLIKDRWPEAEVALATGRGVVEGQVTAGEVVDRAARLLQGHVEEHQGVWVDTLSAELLGARFVLVVSPEGVRLVGEEKDTDDSRPLLGKPTPCVGRDAELGSLEAQLAGCIEEAEARAVLVTAPPGIGKSRLRHELVRRVALRFDALTVLLGRGDLMSAGAPYGGLRQALGQLCELEGQRSLEGQRARLAARVERCASRTAAERQRIAEFLGEIGGIPFPDEESPLLRAARHDPKIMRDQIRLAFVDWLRAECREAPVMLVLDDLQWGDAMTVGLVDHALRELASAPLFVLALGRPELHAAFPRLWQGHRLQHVALRGLGKRACERLIHKALGDEAAPEVVGRIVLQSAGNALFLEELIRAAAEGKTEAQPETVVAMLQARVSRFEAGPRRALRAASVFGPTFRRDGVAALLDLPEGAPEIDGWLDALVEAEVIEGHGEGRLRGDRGDHEMAFRHALMAEATYELLSADDRVTGHRLAGAFLERAGEQDPRAIAEHHERAGDEERAVEFYVRAADRALDSYDLTGALRCVEHGVACGAEGEALGTLRSIESCASQWLNRVDRCLAAADEALPLLRRGSRHWTRNAWIAIFAALGGPPAWRARVPELIDMFVGAEPEPDARVSQAEGLSWLAAGMSVVWPRARVQILMDRLEAICTLSSQHDPTALRWLQFPRAHIAWHCDPRPWTALKEGEKAIELCRQTGDVRIMLSLLAHEGKMTWFELGDAEGALSRLRSHLGLAQLHQETYVKGVIAQHIASILSRRDDDASLQEAEKYATEMIEGASGHRLGLGLAHENLARVKLKRRQPAEAAASRACEVLEFMPLYGLGATATLVYARLSQGSAGAATEVAEKGLATLLQHGGGGYAEVEMRLAASEAFHAAGDLDRARAELGEALRQIALRAEDIADPAWRERYVNDNQDNARARELARAWGVEAGG